MHDKITNIERIKKFRMHVTSALNTLRVLCVVAVWLLPFVMVSQTSVVINPSVTFQTIHGFGASDAWNVDFVGKFWSIGVRNDIARRLFSQRIGANGVPEGIGLSRWRFNIGAGSAEQGAASNIEMPERRVECFLNEDGTYNWNKQAGQQWFLQQAKEYGVEHLVAFVNSPPRFFTKNGRANSNNTNRFGTTNLRADQYDEFAEFLARVLKHFSDQGLPFSQISPVNEPQYEWNSGQEGSPWNNDEIKTLAVELNAAILRHGLNTKMLLAEAASYDYIHQVQGDANKSDQIWKFFNASRPEYLGNLSQMMPGICAHSYWTDGSDASIVAARTNVLRESREQGGIELYQTEYNLLTRHFPTKLENSIFLAKMIHADLTIANVSIWDYWTALERERWSQLNRFYLIRLHPNGGDYAALTGGGTVSYDRNLWVLGNYSLFIRPGYRRIAATGASDLNGLMGSAFLAPDSSRMVVVYVNWGTQQQMVQHHFTQLPSGFRVNRMQPYVTDATRNLAPMAVVNALDPYAIPPRSVVTFLVDLEPTTASVANASRMEKNLFPNPVGPLAVIHSEQLRNASFSIYKLDGAKVMEGRLGNDRIHTLNLTTLAAGTYIFKSKQGMSKFQKK